MCHHHAIVLILGFILAAPLPGQIRVDPRNQHERVYAIVPMVGSGTPGDPRRPAHVPLKADGRVDLSGGFLGFTMQLSDDGGSRWWNTWH